MKNNYNTSDIEELKQSLPDYLTNKIEDKNLISAIEKALEENAGFKSEAEELRHTFGFLQNTELAAPPDNYFTNLSVKINGKIQQSENKESLWERLGLVWKILIPAIAVIIITGLLVMNYLETDVLKKELTDKNIKEEKKTEEVKIPEGKTEVENLENKINGNSDKQNLSEEKISVTEKNVNSKNKFTKNKTETLPKEIKEFKNSENSQEKEQEKVKDDLNIKLNDLIADNFYNSDNPFNSSDDDTVTEEDNSDLFFQNEADDENNIEEEFKELSTEEQIEILNNLSKSKI